jgi:hypothetical protein
VSTVVEGDVLEVLDGQVAVERAVEDAQQVAVELGRHPGGVVVGGLDDGWILDQVGTQEQVVPGSEQRADLHEHAPARAGREVADRAAEQRDEARGVPDALDVIEVSLEVADDARDPELRIVGLQAAGRAGHDAPGHVERHVAP